MKKICLLLILVLCVSSLSSCLLMTSDNPFGGLTEGFGIGGDTTINVDGGNNYEKIEINTSGNASLLAASKAMLSAVKVIAFFEEPTYNLLGTQTGTKETWSAGSGVIYKMDKTTGSAYIITNYHVVHNDNATEEDGISDKIKLSLYGMEYKTSEDKTYEIEATFLGGSMCYDIAVLYVENSPILIESNARAADIADSDNVTVLDTAIAVGNPGNGGLSATVGYINVDSEEIVVAFEKDGKQVGVELRVMRTDAAVNSGNSGGGLFNDKGELIGIVNAKSSNTSEENIGYAIPSNVAVAIAENAMDYNDGGIYRCMLGITMGVKSYKTEYDLETGKVKKIEEAVVMAIGGADTPDDKSDDSPVIDIIRVGDVIHSISINGEVKEITRMHQVVDAMLHARVGDIVKMNITRAQNTFDIEIQISETMVTAYRYPPTA